MSAHRDPERIAAASLPPFRFDPDLACREPGVSPEVFFPASRPGARRATARAISRAKNVCRRCPLRDKCAKWAIETRQEHGVWGATTGSERKAIWKKTEGDA